MATPTQRRNDRRLASLDEAASYAATSKRTIRRRIADGTIQGYRFGPRQLRVDLNELDAALRTVPAVSRSA